MDDTHQSRTSDASAAAATRKRRSSILKSQRPPRTPFSELEFNVATPTDTAKSRRVSFSRRTGVAEFVTNEATTTWKNFYEEHNKSLESSGNDSQMNQQRQPIGHIGKRIFDQQFQEVEAVDFVSSLDNHSRNVNTSLNNVNYAEQLASLECTGDDKKLTAPQPNFEMSAFTDHQSKLFGDDFAPPTLGEMSGRIDVNFSAIQAVGSVEVKDDLDEIEKDLERAQNNVICPGPFNDRELSEYIEVDLNTTHAAVRNDQSDMSITDTIHSPKVQDVSKSNSLQMDKKSSFNQDWVADKENIVLNPYVAPKEDINFAINDESDKILVFDGKKLTVKSDKEADALLKNTKDDNQTLIEPVKHTHPRKTIVLNVNDDLPNFIDDPNMASSHTSFKHSVMYDDDDISITQPLSNNLDVMPGQAINESGFGNLSVTQAVPANLILPSNTEKRRTIVYENDGCNISITQALPANIIGTLEENKSERRKTILYDNDNGNISITQALPANIKIIQDNEPERRKTIVFESDTGDISITQAVPANILKAQENKEPERRQTIVYEDDTGDISITQALPVNIIGSQKQEKRKTILFEDDNDNISITQAIPPNILLNDNSKSVIHKSKTFENYGDIDISVTQAVPSNLLLFNNVVDNNRTVAFEEDEGDVSVTRGIPSNILTNQVDNRAEKRRTIVFDNDMGNISITQTIPSNIMPTNSESLDKRKSVVYGTDADVNVTQAVPINILTINKKRKTIIYDDDTGNLSVTQAIPNNIIVRDQSKTIISEDSLGNISITQAVPIAKILSKEISNFDYTSPVQEEQMSPIQSKEIRRKTILYNEDAGNISVTQAIPTNIILSSLMDKEIDKSKITDQRDTSNASLQENNYIKESPNNKSVRSAEDQIKTIVFEESNADMSISEDIPHKITPNSKDKENKNNSLIFEADITANNTKENKFLLSGAFEKSLINDQIVISKDLKKKINESMTTHTNQDVFVYQAMTQNDMTKNDEDGIREPATGDVLNCDKENTSLSFSKSYSKDSNIEKDRSMQVSQTHIVQQEIDEQPEKDIENDVETNAGIKLLEHIPLDQDENRVSEHTRQAVLNELLDMSCSSLESGIESKNILAQEDTQTAIVEKAETENDSSESFIYIVKENEGETQTDKGEKRVHLNKSLKWENGLPKIDNSPPLPIEYKEEKVSDLSVDITKKISALKSLVNDDIKTSPDNRRYEKVISPDIDNKRELLDVTKGAKSFRDANDTNELLEMLSDLTDRSRISRDSEKPSIESIQSKSQNTEAYEPRRLSVAPNRMSIVLSREDLLTNISMAQAALQRSIEMDESLDSSVTPVEEDSPKKKSVRMSNEVVKKLQFEEDESTSELSLKAGIKSSPLKKTAFGETTYMKENKAKVIPSYLNDVSDEIKELMNDLVKPNADVLPFQAAKVDKDIKREASTCSTQIQANLITSSQIDIDTAENSPRISVFDMDKVPSPSTHVESGHSRRSSFKSSAIDKTNLQQSSLCQQNTLPSYCTSDRVILFDHTNPLNNVLLVPCDYSDVHKYEPPTSTDTLCTDKVSNELNSTTKHSSQSSQNQPPYNVERVSYVQCIKQAGDFMTEKILNAHSTLSECSKPTSIDESVSVSVCELKDMKVNTLIAMKGNKELLEASSSLTLVDDALDLDIDNVTTIVQSPEKSKKQSPVKIIYQNDEHIMLQKTNSDFTSNDELESIECKGKKRIYSPHKRDKDKHGESPSVDVTPKPISKMQKMSKSPYLYNEHEVPEKLQAEKDESACFEKSLMDLDFECKSSKESKTSEKKKSRKSKSKIPGANVTVQQLMTEYNIQPKIDHEALNKQILEVINKTDSSTGLTSCSQTDILGIHSPEIVSSFTSSKNQNEMHDACSVATTETESLSVQSNGTRSEWQPELATERSCKNLVTECDSSVNVVAKIDMLPFMGSPECEWEPSGIDTWSFRLLYARLRLTVRLAHRHDNATRTRVRADTPVLAVALDVAYDDKNPVAVICVKFATDAMKYFVSRKCSRAGDVPLLLRRCAGVARVALRWGRAMHEARMHLAYTLNNDGILTLKVANIPLLSVWEVSMRIESAAEESQSSPWPRAADVRVARVVSDVAVGDEEVKRALARLPNNWGHVPRTVWKIFKYLKNKTREDDLLGV